MHVCNVDAGDEVLQIVCNALSINANRLVVAKIGAVKPYGPIIKPVIKSYGLICLAQELGFNDTMQKEGILVLDSHNYHIGDGFFKEE